MKTPVGYKFRDYTVAYSKLPTADLERMADDLLALAMTLDVTTKKSWVTEDQLNAALTVIQWRKDARNRNPIDRETLRDWTAGKINKRLDVLSAQSSKLNDALIAAGRGYELSSETMKKTDPLAMKFRAVHDEYSMLRREIDRRYGPGAPSRLPTRGRNPVPKSSRAGRPRRSRDEIEQAADLYERFSGHEAESIGTVKAPRSLKTAIAIGDCDGILYTTVRDNRTEKYIHKFRAKDRPLLTVAPDGSQIVLVGGNYRFTEQGIVDRSDKKNWKE